MRCWRAHQAAGDGEHLLLAAGQRAGGLARPLGEPRKQSEDAVAVFRASGAGARQHGADVEILLNRQRRKNLTSLRHLADAEIADAMAWPAGYVRAAKADPPAQLALHAGERANERRLAGAIGADDGDDRALRDLKRHAVKRLDVAVEYVEIFDGEHHTVSAPR